MWLRPGWGQPCVHRHTSWASLLMMRMHMISYLVRDIGTPCLPRAEIVRINIVETQWTCLSATVIYCHFTHWKHIDSTSSHGPFMSLGPFKCCALELKVSTVCNYCPSSHHQPSTHDGMWIWTLFADIPMRLESNLASISQNRNKPRQACANCQLFAHRPPPRAPFLVWAPHPDSLDTSRAVVPCQAHSSHWRVEIEIRMKDEDLFYLPFVHAHT